MGPNADVAPLPLDALVRRADEVRRGRLDGRVVRLVSHDAPARLATLRSLYTRLVEHPRLGGAWPWALPPGALAPALPPTTFPGIPPRVFWFGLCATDDPAVEIAQLCEQLAQLTRFPDLPDWVERIADVSCAALMGSDRRLTADARSTAFSFLAPERVDSPEAVRSALRTLHELTSDRPLAGDGGLLRLDGPSPAARALLAAGWLERLSRLGVVVLAIDEAHRAGPFLAGLVRELMATEAPALVVLAGEPADRAEADLPLAGALGGVSSVAGQPTALPAGDAGYLGAALAAVCPTGVFAEEHVRVMADAIGVGDDAGSLYDELVTSGWLRPLTRRVSAFGGARRHDAAVAQAPELLGDELLARGAALCRDAAGRADDEPLPRLLAAAARHAADPDDTDAAWDHAVLLARAGSPADALRIAEPAAAGDPRRDAHVAAWRSLVTGVAPAGGADIAAVGVAEVERRLVLAAAGASVDPAATVGHLVAGLAALADDDTIGVDEVGRLRAAAARIFLTVGHVDGVAHALGPEPPAWLPGGVVKRLVELHAHRQSPVLVEREVALAQARHCVQVLTELAPASRVLAQATLGLLALLDDGERLAAAGDEATGAAARARAILERDGEQPPLQRWRARRWEAIVQHRRGDGRAAATALAALVDEQCAAVRADHPDVADTMLRLAQVLLETQRVDEAAAAVDRARRSIDAAGLDEDDSLRLDADQAWAGVLLARGAHQDAAVHTASVVRRRAARWSASDERLLRARSLLASALARDGRPAEALRHLDDVVGRRAAGDLPDGRRLLAARQERAGCLVMLHRYAEALAELDVVVTQRARLVPSSDVTLLSARCDRALCLLMLQRWAEALVDLDPALAVLSVRFAPDDERVLLMRQQRAVCLHALRRTAEALAELDGMVAATATWAREHPFVVGVLRQRTDVAASVVPATATALTAPPRPPVTATH